MPTTKAEKGYGMKDTSNLKQVASIFFGYALVLIFWWAVLMVTLCQFCGSVQ